MGFSIYDVKLVETSSTVVPDTYTPPDHLVPMGGYNWVSMPLSILAASTDTVDILAQLWIYDVSMTSGTLLGSIVIPAGAGNGTVPTVELLAALPIPLNGPLLLQAQFSLVVHLLTPPATGKLVYLSATYGLL